MNLKEAFRMQNILSQHLNTVKFLLDDTTNLVKRNEIHFHNKACPDMKNEEFSIKRSADKISATPQQLFTLSLLLLEQKEKLTQAIWEAKQKLPYDIDGAASVNSYRQQLQSSFAKASLLKSSEDVVKNDGMGYCFNKEGNQVSYRYDIKYITTIDFDRNYAKSTSKALSSKMDEVSSDIDALKINTTVDFEPMFDPNESIEEILESLEE